MSNKKCPILPSLVNRQVCTASIVGLGVGLGSYYKLQKSDLKVFGGAIDLQKYKWFIPGVSILVASGAASAATLLSYMLSNRK
mgnify:CR=1 FL=1